MNTGKLQNELNNLKDNVIGLFRHNNLGVFELVVRDNGDSVNTVYLSSLGGVSTTSHLPLHYGKYVKFPNGQNFNELLSKPFEYAEFMKENFNV